MKKYLLPGFLIFFITACTMGTPSPTAVTVIEATATQDTLPPTPEAVTVTPEITATVTLPPTPEPPPSYFSDEFDTLSPYWNFLQTGGGNPPTQTVENGSLRVNISSADTWAVGIHNVHSYSNVFVRAAFSANPSGSVGLICRYDESIGWFEYNVASDGTYSVLIGEWLADGIVQYKPIASGDSRIGGLSGEIGLFCEDNFLRLYANGTLIRNLEVTNYGLTEGYIGITASSFADAPMTSVFEWVKVDSQ